jgi:hypothetical protein
MQYQHHEFRPPLEVVAEEDRWTEIVLPIEHNVIESVIDVDDKPAEDHGTG